MHGSTKRARVRIAATLLVALLAAGVAGGGLAGADTTEATTGAGSATTAYPPNRGWYAPHNSAYALSLTAECVDTSYGPVVRVKARTIMWARGSRIKGFHFKARLVVAGSDGQIQSTAWSDNFVRGFAPTSAQVRKGMVALLPSQNANADWDIEVKMKFPRSIGTAYRHKFRVPFVEPDCGI